MARLRKPKKQFIADRCKPGVREGGKRAFPKEKIDSRYDPRRCDSKIELMKETTERITTPKISA
jgi:hypothetical protein